MSYVLDDLFVLVKDHLWRTLGGGLKAEVVDGLMVLQLKCGHALTFASSDWWPTMAESDYYPILDEIDRTERPCFCVLADPLSSVATVSVPDRPIWKDEAVGGVEVAVWAAAYALAFSEHGDAQRATRAANDAALSLEDL